MRKFRKLGYITRRLVSLCAAVVIAAGTYAGVSALETIETQAQYSGDWSSYYVDNFGLNSYAVTLYPNETFRLYTGNIGKVTYSSNDTAVAAVSSSGLITAKKTGNAVITVKSAAYGSRQCTVLVVADNGTYIDTLDNQISYKMAASSITLTTNRAEIYIDKGIAYSANLVSIIDNIMTAIESLTGYKFITSDYPGKVQIDFPAQYITASNGGAGGVCLSEDEAIPELTDCYYAIAHELLHTVQMRNTGDAGLLMTEGFAEALCDDVVKKAGISSAYSTQQNMDGMYTFQKGNIYYYSSNHEYVNVGTSVKSFTLTASNLEKIFNNIDGSGDIHAISYYLVRYIRETYGLSTVKKILTGIGNAGSDISAGKAFEIIENKTTSTFKSDFASWYNKLSFPYYETKSVGTAACFNGVCRSVKWLESFTSFHPSYSRFKYKNSITFDLTRSVAFAQNVYGKKYWGMRVSLGGGGTATFYDADGKVIYRDTISTGTFTYNGIVYYNSDMYSIKGAVKLVVTQSGTNTLSLFCNNPEEMYAESYESYPIRIISSPADVSVEEGGKAIFSVDAAGLGLSYRWLYKDSSGKVHTADGSCNGPVLTLTAASSMNGNYYYCLITDSNGNTKYSDLAKLTVTKSNIKATGITLNKTSAKLTIGSSVSLSATISPANVTDNTVKWVSSDPSVATVDKNGLVTAVSCGDVVITATSGDGCVHATANIKCLFKDVTDSSAYFYNPVCWAAKQGITKGYTTGAYAGNFGVGFDCSRQDFVLFLYRMAGSPTEYSDGKTAVQASDADKFTDVASSELSSTFRKAIAWAIDKGITKGYDDNTFGVGKSIVRKDAIIMLYRYADKPKMTITTTGFTDVDGVYNTNSDTFKSIAWAETNGITNGLTEAQAAEAGLTSPAFGCNVSCLREQMITFIYRLNKLLNK